VDYLPIELLIPLANRPRASLLQLAQDTGNSEQHMH
jgi:hypothetical protein